MSFAVLALNVSSADIDIAQGLRGTAARFPPHVTLVPRFATRSAMAVRKGAQRWRRALSPRLSLAGLSIELRGLRRIAPDLAWYECERGCRGRTELERLHRTALSELLDDGLGGPDPGIILDSYRPHLTLWWRASSPGPSLFPPTLLVHPTSVCIYRYGRDPHRSRIARETVAEMGS